MINIPNNLDPKQTYLHIPPEMIPVPKPHLLAIMDFFWKKVVPADGEAYLNALRQAYQAHEASKADSVRLEEGRAKHAALARAANIDAQKEN